MPGNLLVAIMFSGCFLSSVAETGEIDLALFRRGLFGSEGVGELERTKETRRLNTEGRRSGEGEIGDTLTGDSSMLVIDKRRPAVDTVGMETRRICLYAVCVFVQPPNITVQKMK